jgi:hypothetical protein
VTRARVGVVRGQYVVLSVGRLFFCLCQKKMSKVFRWLYVMLEGYGGGQEDGYVLGQSMIYYDNRAECVKDAKKWLTESASYDMCTLSRGPYLVIETVDGNKNKY